MAETNYIPLSRNLLTDPKVKALQKRYGKAEGVGHWAILLLELYASGANYINLREDFLREAIMDDHGMEMEELYELIDICAKVGLVDPMLWSSNRQLCNSHVNEQKQEWANSAKQHSDAGKKSGESRRKKSEGKGE